MNTTNIISITDLRRNFGDITKDLWKKGEILLTRDGRPFAILRAAPEEKRKRMKEFAGIIGDTDLDNNEVWEEILKKKSRKKSVEL